MSANFPTYISICPGLVLDRQRPGHHDALWTAPIGPLEVSIWTRGGQWWAKMEPSPSPFWGPFDTLSETTQALSTRLTDALKWLKKAEANLVAAIKHFQL